MKKSTLLILTITALTSLVAITVWAASPHFVGKVTATLTGNNVQVCFKEAGLGNNQNITYTASANATATYVCVNGGGQCPNAANKTTVTGVVSVTGTFSSGDNGTISQCLTFSPPSAGTFSCPGGQDLTLSKVSYSDIKITDTTNNVTEAATPSKFSATVFTCP
jgi:hypothetical protein